MSESINITGAEAAFIVGADSAKGRMIEGYCTCCGAKIQLHDKLENGYCRVCGHSVSLYDMKQGKLETTAVEHMSAEQLFEVAYAQHELNGYYDVEQLKRAADKRHKRAVAELVKLYIDDDNYRAARIYARIGSELGIADCKAYAELCNFWIDGGTFQEIFDKMDWAMSLGLSSQARNMCRDYKVQIQRQLDAKVEHMMEIEHRRKMEELAEKASDPYAYGCTGSAYNAGMPYIDVSDM